MIKIKHNGVWTELPACDYNGGLAQDWYDIDADGSGRDEMGLMHRDRVATKRKLNCKWSNIRQSQVAFILSLIGDVFFEVQYEDLDGTIKEGVFYAGDRQAPTYSRALGEPIYSSFTVNFIER